jgi:hypothetical protein
MESFRRSSENHISGLCFQLFVASIVHPRNDNMRAPFLVFHITVALQNPTSSNESLMKTKLSATWIAPLYSRFEVLHAVRYQSSGHEAIKTYLFLMTAADAHRSRCREFADPHVHLDFTSLICAGGSRLSSSNFQLNLPHPQDWCPIDLTLSPRHRWMPEDFRTGSGTGPAG